MAILSALSTATRWLFKRDTAPTEPNPVTKGIELMAKFKDRGERMDAIVEKIKEKAQLQEDSSKTAVQAEQDRIEYERQLLDEENGHDTDYDELVKFIADLAPIPRTVLETIEGAKAKAEEDARLKAEAEAEAARAEEARLKSEAAAAAPPAPPAPPATEPSTAEAPVPEPAIPEPAVPEGAATGPVVADFVRPVDNG